MLHVLPLLAALATTNFAAADDETYELRVYVDGMS